MRSWIIWPGRSPACCISSSGLTDTDAADGSAGVRRPATSGIAANRLKVTAVSTAVTIRVTLRIGTSIKLPAGARGIGRGLSRRRDQPAEAGVEVMVDLIEDFLEIFGRWYNGAPGRAAARRFRG